MDDASATDGIERLFIATSDYVDEETGEDIYLAARQFYEHKLNAQAELKLNHFYAPGEAKYIYSLPVFEPSVSSFTSPNNIKARFVGLFETADSETAYTAEWEEMTVPAGRAAPTGMTEDEGMVGLNEMANPKEMRGAETQEQGNSRPSNLKTRSLAALIDEAKSYGARVLFITLPDYISVHHTAELRAAGFTEIGRLTNYFSNQVDEIYWSMYFD